MGYPLSQKTRWAPHSIVRRGDRENKQAGNKPLISWQSSRDADVEIERGCIPLTGIQELNKAYTCKVLQVGVM